MNVWTGYALDDDLAVQRIAEWLAHRAITVDLCALASHESMLACLPDDITVLDRVIAMLSPTSMPTQWARQDGIGGRPSGTCATGRSSRLASPHDAKRTLTVHCGR